MKNIDHMLRVHIAIDVIQYDSIYEKVIQFICGNSMVCDDLSIAKEICYNRKQEIKGTIFK